MSWTNLDRLGQAVDEFESAATELSESLEPFDVTDCPISEKIIEAKHILEMVKAAKQKVKDE